MSLSSLRAEIFAVVYKMSYFDTLRGEMFRSEKLGIYGMIYLDLLVLEMLENRI